MLFGLGILYNRLLTKLVIITSYWALGDSSRGLGLLGAHCVQVNWVSGSSLEERYSILVPDFKGLENHGVELGKLEVKTWCKWDHFQLKIGNQKWAMKNS